ncbi:MerR family transcriptional regulator [Spiroplasma tabanidicola]|uniref:MerR family transcriptional regulator n=1 Tax=Spiroplasma tabanidicola TaxID=324079 RepID=A0A6I6CC01_9MOLU|nr:MerR family transcriptional regulator [Spiroplasma tabanidicola]QGS51464.1 MerR family transcriptional regulator [Spiroplasma tabanidicola]
MEKKLYVSEIAKQFNLTENTIRFYEKKGLMPYMKRDKNNYRYILEDDVKWFDTVICLKKTGMSILEIKEYIKLAEKGNVTAAKRLEMIVNQKKVVNEQLEFLKKQLGFLDYKIEYYNNILEKENKGE